MPDQIRGSDALYVRSGSGTSGSGAEPGPIGSVAWIERRWVCCSFGVGVEDDEGEVVEDGAERSDCSEASSEDR